VSAWWARYRLAGGRNALRAVGTVVDAPMETLASQAVSSADALLADSFTRARAWTSRPAALVDQPVDVLEDLCVGPPDGSRPWQEETAPYTSTALTYLRLRDALLFTESGMVMASPWTMVAETRGYWSYGLRPLPKTQRYLPDQMPQFRLANGRPRRLVDGPTLSLCHMLIGAYGHWFTDVAAGIYDLLEPIRADRLRILAPPLAAWQRRTLELLGVPGSALIETGDASIGGSDIVCHSFRAVDHGYKPTTISRELFQLLRAAKIERSNVETPRLIYLSRSDIGSPRNYVDAERMEVAIRKLGFAVLHPEKLTLDEQIAAFSRAEVVVGPHGSAFANIGFAPPGALVVRIAPDYMKYQWVCGLVRHLHHRLLILTAKSWKVDANESPQRPLFLSRRNFSIDPELVVERVHAAMGRLGIRPGGG
jgi:hypothetical protein